MEKKTILIQENLLADLKIELPEFNKQITESNKGKVKGKKSRLKLDVAVCFINLVNRLPFQHKDDDENDGVAYLYSKIMKKAYHDEYSRYISFLIKKGFIELVSKHDTSNNKSRGYRINPKYTKIKFTSYEITDKTLLNRMRNNKFTKDDIENKRFCESKRPHLVKWFDENLTINKDDVLEEIKELLQTDETKYKGSMYSTFDIFNKKFKFSIDPKTDNRLHTTFSMSDKLIRKYIYYKNENINGLDVKTSQMYFLCAILKAILAKDLSILDRIEATKILDDKIIFRLFHLQIDENEVNEFIKSVVEHKQDFYVSFSKKINISYNEKRLPIRKEFKVIKDKSKWKKGVEPYKIKPYKNERALAKRAIVEILNSSPKTKIVEALTFKQEYPSIFKIISCIKDYGIELWRLLNYVEAYCLLDYAAFKFAEKYPNIFLTSIHDCLVTTASHIELLEQEIKQHIKDVTTLELAPKFDIEDWRDSKVEIAA